jgi:uracil-DNA glycosylase
MNKNIFYLNITINKMNTYHESWKPLFDKFSIDIDEIYSGSEVVYPEKEHLFRVFEMDVKEIKILLLGQDPYHGPDQAHGLSFSVPEGIKIPPSLRNIYKELQNEFPERNYEFYSGNLEKWFYREKIFLLNASLSVIKEKPGSQMKIWEGFTNNVIKFVSEQNKSCVFMLLGNFAKAKECLISNKERIIKGVHPSPLSVYNGFFGSGIFKKVEELLGANIDWSN